MYMMPEGNNINERLITVDMNMDKEKWIDEVMGSAKGREQANPNPFLYEKVIFRLQQKVTAGDADVAFVYKWAATVLLLVGINGVLIFNAFAHKQHRDGPQRQGIFSEMDTQAYNY